MTQMRHSARTKARKRALDILFEAELRGCDPLVTLADRQHEATPPVRDFTTEIVSGVQAHLTEIDQRIRACLDSGWTIDRMPRVDRNLARIAIFEIDYTNSPAEAAIAEAVRLSEDLSTEESPGFLNGMLSVAFETSSRRN